MLTPEPLVDVAELRWTRTLRVSIVSGPGTSGIGNWCSMLTSSVWKLACML